MKICFVGPANSAHLVKWANWFSEHGHEVYVVSFVLEKIENVTVYSLSTRLTGRENDFLKIKYLFEGKKIKRLIDRINPDIINVHYATSYGATVALSGVKGYILSVWGSDVYDFPNKSILHRKMLEYSLNKAKYLFSTSQAMADESKKYTDKKFIITPFGVDVGLFNPEKRYREEDDKDFIVGTVKTLKPKYGIEYLLKAVALIRQREPAVPIKVRIAGDGPNADKYKQYARNLGVNVTWLGFISQEKAAKEWANMDVAVIPSTSESESFGVSAVEAEASGVPVIISDVPGLMEATKPGISSIVVQRSNEISLAEAILELYNAPEKRYKMGNAGRQYVLENYSLNECFSGVNSIFEQIRSGGGEK